MVFGKKYSLKELVRDRVEVKIGLNLAILSFVLQV